MLGPFATASRRTPIHQVSLLSQAATVARRLRIDVHDNDNAWQRGPLIRYGPIEWAQKHTVRHSMSVLQGTFYEYSPQNHGRPNNRISFKHAYLCTVAYVGLQFVTEACLPAFRFIDGTTCSAAELAMSFPTTLGDGTFSKISIKKSPHIIQHHKSLN